MVGAFVAYSGLAAGGEIGQGTAAPQGAPVAGSTYGVPITPGVYLVNFLLLYIANPKEAANMPAYMASLPAAVVDCLHATPEGCSYADYKGLLGGGTAYREPIWPRACEEEPRWQQLAPSVARHPDQINEPLGKARAAKLARILGIDKTMVLTDKEYQCTVGTPPRNDDQEIIADCIADLSNSKGNSADPLSSYGLSVTDQGLVQSDCAPGAACLVFNQLFAGPLEKIAKQCGWADKLARMVAKTPFFRFVESGHKCQQYSGAPTSACLVKPASHRSGVPLF